MSSMNRTQFRQLSKQGQLITLEQARQIALMSGKDILTKAVKDYSAVLALALRDELGMGHKRASKFLDRVSTMFQDIQAGLLSVDDIKEQLKLEIGVEIK